MPTGPWPSSVRGGTNVHHNKTHFREIGGSHFSQMAKNRQNLKI